MKSIRKPLSLRAGWPLALAGWIAVTSLAQSQVATQPPPPKPAPEPPEPMTEEATTKSETDVSDPVKIMRIETTIDNDVFARKDLPWLGLSTSEATEALTAQLNLKPGVGLVVTHVTPDSPAAKAGLQKNDLLTRLEDQSLVHPAQLRKLVQVRKEGDTVKLVFYRGGKEQTATATLTKSPHKFGLLEGDGFQFKIPDLQRHFQDLNIDENVREQMEALKKSLGNLKLDQKKVQLEIRRSMDEARKALHEALRQTENADSADNLARKTLEDLADSGVTVDENATVTVRSTGKGVKSVVQTDDTGTVVIVANPKPRLTAHDKEGRLVFDGEIENQEQRDKVPRDLWKRVEPLVDKMTGPLPEEPDKKAEE
ncbi:MAG TPA: PDZ domain-containing protein [Clostridia bacterium]|nr:PDZ domain-containing protein [Clostridia bacterium]